MPQKRACVDRLARRHRPRRIHQPRAPHARREREPARERLAQADEIRHRAAVFAREPFAGAAESRVDLVQNQQHPVFIT